MRFMVRGVSQDIADEVRKTRRSPGYGHPTHAELARGHGPCRCCLKPFIVGRDERILFTFRPRSDASSLIAPGPVFVHAAHCVAFAGDAFPDALRELPLAFEARASESRVIALSAATGVCAETQIERLFSHPDTAWLHLRHAEAGCFIARIDRDT